MRLRKTTRVIAYGLLTMTAVLGIGLGSAMLVGIKISGEGYAGLLGMALIAGASATAYIASTPEDDR